MKLNHGRFRLDFQKGFITQRMVQHWDRFLREVVTAPSLAEVTEYLDNPLGHVVGFLGCAAQG